MSSQSLCQVDFKECTNYTFHKLPYHHIECIWAMGKIYDILILEECHHLDLVGMVIGVQVVQGFDPTLS